MSAPPMKLNTEITRDILNQALDEIMTMVVNHHQEINGMFQECLDEDGPGNLAVTMKLQFDFTMKGLRVRPSMTIPGLAIKTSTEFYADGQPEIFPNPKITVTMTKDTLPKIDAALEKLKAEGEAA